MRTRLPAHTLGLVAALLLLPSAQASATTISHTANFGAGFADRTGGITGVHWVFFPGNSALPWDRLLDFGELTTLGVTRTYGPTDPNFAAVADFMSDGSWLGNFASAFTPNGSAGNYNQLGAGAGFTFPEVTNPLMLFRPTEFSLTLNAFPPRLETGPCPCTPVYFVNYAFTVTGDILGLNPVQPATVPEPGSLILFGTGLCVMVRVARRVGSQVRVRVSPRAGPTGPYR